ncbi:MAG: hypothetical protein Q9226_007089 [Calogaya cf. arnoldii]
MPSLDGASPHTPDSDVHEPLTPEADHAAGIDFSQDAAVKDFFFEDMLFEDMPNFDVDFE